MKFLLALFAFVLVLSSVAGSSTAFAKADFPTGTFTCSGHDDGGRPFTDKVTITTADLGGLTLPVVEITVTPGFHSQGLATLSEYVIGKEHLLRMVLSTGGVNNSFVSFTDDGTFKGVNSDACAP